VSAITIGFNRSDTRQEDNLRINASILSAFEVGSVATIADFFVQFAQAKQQGPVDTPLAV
jgi:hypothetical protein